MPPKRGTSVRAALTHSHEANARSEFHERSGDVHGERAETQIPRTDTGMLYSLEPQNSAQPAEDVQGRDQPSHSAQHHKHAAAARGHNSSGRSSGHAGRLWPSEQHRPQAGGKIGSAVLYTPRGDRTGQAAQTSGAAHSRASVGASLHRSPHDAARDKGDRRHAEDDDDVLSPFFHAENDGAVDAKNFHKEAARLRRSSATRYESALDHDESSAASTRKRRSGSTDFYRKRSRSDTFSSTDSFERAVRKRSRSPGGENYPSDGETSKDVRRPHDNESDISDSEAEDDNEEYEQERAVLLGSAAAGGDSAGRRVSAAEHGGASAVPASEHGSGSGAQSHNKPIPRFIMQPKIAEHFHCKVWYEEEKTFLLELFGVYGRDWDILSRLMSGSKSPTAIKLFYYENRKSNLFEKYIHTVLNTMIVPGKRRGVDAKALAARGGLPGASASSARSGSGSVPGAFGSPIAGNSGGPQGLDALSAVPRPVRRSNGSNCLTEDEVRDIYSCKPSTNKTSLSKVLAKQYGVNEKTIRDIWDHRIWKKATLALAHAATGGVVPAPAAAKGGAVPGAGGAFAHGAHGPGVPAGTADGMGLPHGASSAGATGGGGAPNTSSGALPSSVAAYPIVRDAHGRPLRPDGKPVRKNSRWDRRCRLVRRTTAEHAGPQFKLTGDAASAALDAIAPILARIEAAQRGETPKKGRGASSSSPPALVTKYRRHANGPLEPADVLPHGEGIRRFQSLFTMCKSRDHRDGVWHEGVVLDARRPKQHEVVEYRMVIRNSNNDRGAWVKSEFIQESVPVGTEIYTYLDEEPEPPGGVAVLAGGVHTASPGASLSGGSQAPSQSASDTVPVADVAGGAPTAGESSDAPAAASLAGASQQTQTQQQQQQQHAAQAASKTNPGGRSATSRRGGSGLGGPGTFRPTYGSLPEPARVTHAPITTFFTQVHEHAARYLDGRDPPPPSSLPVELGALQPTPFAQEAVSAGARLLLAQSRRMSRRAHKLLRSVIQLDPVVVRRWRDKIANKAGESICMMTERDMLGIDYASIFAEHPRAPRRDLRTCSHETLVKYFSIVLDAVDLAIDRLFNSNGWSTPAIASALPSPLVSPLGSPTTSPPLSPFPFPGESLPPSPSPMVSLHGSPTGSPSRQHDGAGPLGLLRRSDGSSGGAGARMPPFSLGASFKGVLGDDLVESAARLAVLADPTLEASLLRNVSLDFDEQTAEEVSNSLPPSPGRDKKTGGFELPSGSMDVSRLVMQASAKLERVKAEEDARDSASEQPASRNRDTELMPPPSLADAAAGLLERIEQEGSAGAERSAEELPFKLEFDADVKPMDPPAAAQGGAKGAPVSAAAALLQRHGHAGAMRAVQDEQVSPAELVNIKMFFAERELRLDSRRMLRRICDRSCLQHRKNISALPHTEDILRSLAQLTGDITQFKEVLSGALNDTMAAFRERLVSTTL